jgi:hypothetical protein
MFRGESMATKGTLTDEEREVVFAELETIAAEHLGKRGEVNQTAVARWLSEGGPSVSQQTVSKALGDKQFGIDFARRVAERRGFGHLGDLIRARRGGARPATEIVLVLDTTDPYPERQDAVAAARLLKRDERAIAKVLARPGFHSDSKPPVDYWFREIERAVEDLDVPWTGPRGRPLSEEEEEEMRAPYEIEPPPRSRPAKKPKPKK